MDLGGIIGFVMPIIMGVIVIVVAWALIKRFGSRLSVPQYQYEAENSGERLKKYLLKASKSNPHYVKTLFLKRTEYSSGGRVGKVKGVLPTKYCTRFLYKNTFFSQKNYSIVLQTCTPHYTHVKL